MYEEQRRLDEQNVKRKVSEAEHTDSAGNCEKKNNINNNYNNNNKTAVAATTRGLENMLCFLFPFLWLFVRWTTYETPSDRSFRWPSS